MTSHVCERCLCELMCAWTECSRSPKTHLRLPFIRLLSIHSLRPAEAKSAALFLGNSGEREEKRGEREGERAIIALPPFSSAALICPWSGKDLTEDADPTKSLFAPSLPTHPHSQSPSHKINFVICLVRYAGTHQEEEKNLHVCVCFVKCRRDACL